METKKTVLVIREFGDFSATLIANDFEVINFPTISTKRVKNLSELEKNIAEIDKYDGIFFTSPKAAEIFLADFDKDYSGKIYILGNRAKSLFENKNFRIVFKDSANTAEEFINSFDESEFADRKFLFLKGNKSLRVIPEMLKGLAEVDETVVYETILFEIGKEFTDELKQKLSRQKIDFICFFSPSGVKNFLKVFDEFEQKETRIAAIGTTTAAGIEEPGFRVDFTASNAKDFASEFCKFFN